jgi:hypothetical protein
VPRSEAAERLAARIAAGEGLLVRRPRSPLEIGLLTHDYQLWSGENRDLLRALFTTAEPGFEYSAFHGHEHPRGPGTAATLSQLTDDIATKLARLRSIAARVSTLPGPEEAPARAAGPSSAERTVTLYGLDAELAEETARFLRELGVAALIADDAARGEEAAAPPAGYAVVLLPADPAPRSVLRLGYLLGALGWTSVTVLRPDGAEVPGDLAGVLSIPLDAGGAWKLWLARELRRAGLPIDTSGILSAL